MEYENEIFLIADVTGIPAEYVTWWTKIYKDKELRNYTIMRIFHNDS